MEWPQQGLHSPINRAVISCYPARGDARAFDCCTGENYETMVRLPGAVGQAISQFEAVRTVAQYLKRKKPACFWGGASLSSGTSSFSALKLKELSYIHAEGFAAGEMKHGPIALIEDGQPVICLLDHHELSGKTLSNLKEAEARGAIFFLFQLTARLNGSILRHTKLLLMIVTQ